MNVKRIVMLGAAMGLLGMGMDAGISHFALRTMKHAGQLVPVVFGLLAGLTLLVTALLEVTDARLRRVARIVGLAAVAVGTIGTAFHMKPFFMLLEEPGWTLDAVEMALRIAPPLMAPGAFAVIGLVLTVIASPKLRLRWSGETRTPSGAHAPAH